MLSTSSYNVYAQTNATTAILTPNTLVPLQNATTTTTTTTNTNTNTTTGTEVTDFKTLRDQYLAQ